MPRAVAVKPAGTWRGEPADAVVLNFDDRHRRRIAMRGSRGLEFLLDLPETVALRGGDALVLDDGRLIEIVAAPELLAEVKPIDTAHLVRIAWHLGNRHLPTEIAGAKLRIRRDHVIEDMLKGFGAKIAHIEGPFEPEGGAYVMAHGGQGHDHKHGDHGHGHDHARPEHDHARPGHSHGHAHHDHEHDHKRHDHEHKP